MHLKTIEEQSSGYSGGSYKSSSSENVMIRRKASPKVKFTLSEDNQLRKLVAKYGENKWEEIAAQIPGRNTRQCHDRWVYYLNPNVKKDPWTEEEENLLYKCYHEIGPHWVKISRFFEGRTDTQIKNKWNVLKRRMEYDRKFTEKPTSPEKHSHDIEKQKIKDQAIQQQPSVLHTQSPNNYKSAPVLPSLVNDPIILNSISQNILPPPSFNPLSIANLMAPMPPKFIRKIIVSNESDKGFPFLLPLNPKPADAN